jgi:hypothetical protein
MSPNHIVVASDFTRYVGGRNRGSSDHSGEEFRQDFLEPALERPGRVVVDLNNLFTVPPSFLDESIGKIVERIGLDEFNRKFEVILTDDQLAIRVLQDVYKKRQAGFLKNRR